MGSKTKYDHSIKFKVLLIVFLICGGIGVGQGAYEHRYGYGHGHICIWQCTMSYGMGMWLHGCMGLVHMGHWFMCICATGQDNTCMSKLVISHIKNKSRVTCTPRSYAMFHAPLLYLAWYLLSILSHSSARQLWCLHKLHHCIG